MRRGDIVFPRQVGDRPGHLERTVILHSSCRKLRAGHFGRQLTWIIHNDQNGPRRGPSARARESTHSTPRAEARGMLRVDTERRFLPRFKNRGLAPSNVSTRATSSRIGPSSQRSAGSCRSGGSAPGSHAARADSGPFPFRCRFSSEPCTSAPPARSGPGGRPPRAE